ncbi:IS91 family transposase [Vibrio vulnificus]
MPTLQRVMHQHFSEYQQTHKLPLYQLKGVSSLLKCRTEAMGGHALYCEEGHLNGYWYNSCGHRSCPQCGALKKERWQRKVEGMLLDIPYHHWVFTLPHALHDIWFYNREACQKLLFASVRKTLQVLSADKQYLGATLGAILSLHTWARNLTFHPHIHCLVTHGGLSEDDWVEPKRKIQFPAKVMMELFRGKYLAGIKKLLNLGKLVRPEGMSKAQLLSLLNRWGRQAWVVHCTKRYEHGSGVAKYLARYIRGGAIKNSQILKSNNRVVKYRYWSHERQKLESITLSSEQFIGRLLHHVALPRKPQYQFVGLYHNRSRESLSRARACHGQGEVDSMSELTWRDFLSQQEKVSCCSECGGALSRLRKLSRWELDFKKSEIR